MLKSPELVALLEKDVLGIACARLLPGEVVEGFVEFIGAAALTGVRERDGKLDGI